MTHSILATFLGFVGVALLLLVFSLSQVRLLTVAGYPYTLLDLVGASLACYSSYLIDFMLFVLLEATWALVAAVALVRRLLNGSAAL